MRSEVVTDAVRSRNDLDRVIRNREQHLLGLFRVTLKAIEISSSNALLNDISSLGEHGDDGERRFLELNDIHKHRYFDHLTLPPLPASFPHARKSGEPNKTKTRAEAFSVNHTRPLDGSEQATNGAHSPHIKIDSCSSSHVRHPSPRPVERFTGQEATADARPIGLETGDQSTDGVALSTKEIESSVIREPSIRPLSTPPSSDDHAFPLESSIPRKQVEEQNHEVTRTGRLLDKDLHRERLKVLDPDNLCGEGTAHFKRSYENIRDSTPPVHDENAVPLSRMEHGKMGHDENPSETALRSQIAISATDDLTGNTLTPNEQLRLEEARAMQPNTGSDNNYSRNAALQKEPPLMPPPNNSPSQVAHDSIMRESVTDVGARQEISREDLIEQNQGLIRPAIGMKDHMFSGMNGDSPRDLTLSRRPPMRIDTGVPSTSASPATTDIRAPVPTANIGRPSSGSVTLSKAVHQPGSAQSPPERMTTRVSSGALRHKSVSEILGETPRPTPNHTEKGPFDRGLGDPYREDRGSLQTPKSASSFSPPDPTAFKQRLNELKERERSKLSTVVFAGSRNHDSNQVHRCDENEIPSHDKDYLLTLFTAKVSAPPRALPLNTLVKTAHKTLSTSEFYVDFNERQACQILSRIYDLQSNNRWSLRQMERSAEPKRLTNHWDILLGQMKWMSTDFREERKWKMAAAQYAADACVAWVNGTLEQRKILQVKVRPNIPHVRSRSLSASTPDLVHSAEDDASEATDDDSVKERGPQGSAPAALFSLPAEHFIFGLNKSPVAEKLLLELPLYQPNVEIQNTAFQITDVSPDTVWKKPLVPVSKYADGKIFNLEDGPPCKRSRYDYGDADRPGSSLEDVEHILRPEQEDVALFDPQNKHIRDRIHTGHAFRPPSEYNMPSQSFFECRQSSQWTPEEDHELRKLVRDYAYNWSLISSCLSSPSVFTSGAERRTPWECFERWITLEGLPIEMAKINYFRAYHARLQAAQKTVEAQQHAMQLSQGNNAQIPVRRRNTQPYAVERRKNARYLHLIDAMRKQAKKRESAIHKQQQLASGAAMRKAHEAVKTKLAVRTPSEFSKLKYQRHLEMEEKAKIFRAQAMQSQRTHQASKGNQQPGQLHNAMHPMRNSIPVVPNGCGPNMAATNSNSQYHTGVGDPSRSMTYMQRPPNGQTNGILPTNGHGVPHAPMQPSAQMPLHMQQRVPPNMVSDAPRIVQEAVRVQAEQQAIHQLRQRQPHSIGQSGSPPTQNHSLLSQNSPAMLASLQGRSSTSPRIQAQSLSSGLTPAINQISSHIRARHPQFTDEQISKMTTDQLSRMSADHGRQQLSQSEIARQSAIQAAAGNANANAVMRNNSIALQAPGLMQQQAAMLAGPHTLAPQQYAQLMHSQQATQQRGASIGSAHGINGSRSCTPMMQRPGSAQGAPRPSQSPGARQVGLAGGQ